MVKLYFSVFIRSEDIFEVLCLLLRNCSLKFLNFLYLSLALFLPNTSRRYFSLKNLDFNLSRTPTFFSLFSSGYIWNFTTESFEFFKVQLNTNVGDVMVDFPLLVSMRFLNSPFVFVGFFRVVLATLANKWAYWLETDRLTWDWHWRFI